MKKILKRPVFEKRNKSKNASNSSSRRHNPTTPMPISLSNLLSSLPLPSPIPSLPFLPTTTKPSLPSRTKEDRPLLLPITLKNPSALRSPIDKNEGGAIESSFPSLAWANVLWYKGGYYNVQVVVGEDEPEEVLLRRFRREVSKAGIIPECRRRMSFENSHEKKKRKAREAARRNRRRPYQPKTPPSTEETSKKAKEERDDEDDDNWELPEGELPY